MKNIVVTGAAGFVGKNLVTALQRLEDISLTAITRDDDSSVLEKALLTADLVFHLAGVNRPKDEEEFARGNADLTSFITGVLTRENRTARIILPSSSQAELDNPYGRSKKAAEDAVLEYHKVTGGSCGSVQITRRVRQMVPAQLQHGGGHLLL